jgi:hypothetical protein
MPDEVNRLARHGRKDIPLPGIVSTARHTLNLFGDGYASELATASGDADSGVTVKLNVGV